MPSRDAPPPLPPPPAPPTTTTTSPQSSAYEDAFFNVCCRIYADASPTPSSSTSPSPTTLDDLVPRLVAPPHRHQGSGYLGFLSSTQSSALDTFTSWVCVHYPHYSKFHSTHDLLRFLRAREFDVVKTAEMYREYMVEYRGKWIVSPYPHIRPIRCIRESLNHLIKEMGRREEKSELVDYLALLPRRTPHAHPSPASSYPPDSETLSIIYDSYLQSMVCGLDRFGRPIVYQRVVDSFRRRYGDIIPLSHRLALLAASQEALRLLCHVVTSRLGYYIDEAVYVMDLDQVHPVELLRHVTSLGAKQEQRFSLDYHPETVGRMILVNVPRGMTTLWRVASHLVPPRTREKFRMTGHDARGIRRIMMESVGGEEVPVCYGGRREFQWKGLRGVEEAERLLRGVGKEG